MSGSIKVVNANIATVLGLLQRILPSKSTGWQLEVDYIKICQTICKILHTKKTAAPLHMCISVNESQDRTK
jgi:hypothetical protein